jgi:hypothetical protein
MGVGVGTIYDAKKRSASLLGGSKMRKGWVENLLSPSPVLTVFAEHGSGHAPGTEDWRGTVEIVGLSNIAGGYFFYRNRAGGALRLQL